MKRYYFFFSDIIDHNMNLPFFFVTNRTPSISEAEGIRAAKKAMAKLARENKECPVDIGDIDILSAPVYSIDVSLFVSVLFALVFSVVLLKADLSRLNSIMGYPLLFELLAFIFAFASVFSFLFFLATRIRLVCRKRSAARRILREIS